MSQSCKSDRCILIQFVLFGNIFFNSSEFTVFFTTYSSKPDLCISFSILTSAGEVNLSGKNIFLPNKIVFINELENFLNKTIEEPTNLFFNCMFLKIY